MTAIHEPENPVVELNVEAAIRNALREAGCTFDQLAEQARTSQFESLRARLAWVAIGGFYKG
jgi:hypothetical protein